MEANVFKNCTSFICMHQQGEYLDDCIIVNNNYSCIELVLVTSNNVIIVRAVKIRVKKDTTKTLQFTSMCKIKKNKKADTILWKECA